MSWHDDYFHYQQETAMEEFLDEQLRRIAEEPVFYYLATYGDAIEARVRRCIEQARTLTEAGYPGAPLVRAAAGIEVTIRFFLARPLLQGAFLSDDWAQLISQKILNGRTAEDRELLPAILRNWKIDITSVRLPDSSQAWEQIVTKVWRRRNDYVHKAEDAPLGDAVLAIDCLEALLSQVVDPLAQKLGFTRERTGCWSVVTVQNPSKFPDLNPPRKFAREDPFEG
ncbi:MAG: hypothetical protein HY695_16710 [Deltaproteobacteria bacterium]|nr:hypothetical protein [Deltaproteobacteria bacterium]